MTDQISLLNKSSLTRPTYGGIEKSFIPADHPEAVNYPSGQPAISPTYGQSRAEPYPPSQSGIPSNYGQSGTGPYPPSQSGIPPNYGQSDTGPYPPSQSGIQPTYGQSGAGPHPAVPPGSAGDQTKTPQNSNDQTQISPSAPALNTMDPVLGYETVSFNPACTPPPSYDESLKGPPPKREQISTLACINEDQAREALLEYVSQHCCYGKSAARDMNYSSIESSSAFHYTLETFAEKRTTSWSHCPYHVGTPIDGPMNGPAPGPWDIAASPRTMFAHSEIELEVPHTASVKPCHTCLGTGSTSCCHCNGSGQNICNFCNGSGHTIVHHNHHHHDDDHSHHHHSSHHEVCSFCCGSGTTRCSHCSGLGRVVCHTCDGCCQLKCYIKLTITWTNHFEDHIVERTALPDELIRGVTGEIAFQEELPRVWPVSHFPDNAINSASHQLVQKHATVFSSERILMQRHLVRVVPVTQVYYSWKDKNSSYFVYGFENKVFCSDYPQSCCCGCTIL